MSQNPKASPTSTDQESDDNPRKHGKPQDSLSDPNSVDTNTPEKDCGMLAERQPDPWKDEHAQLQR